MSTREGNLSVSLVHFAEGLSASDLAEAKLRGVVHLV